VPQLLHRERLFEHLHDAEPLRVTQWDASNVTRHEDDRDTHGAGDEDLERLERADVREARVREDQIRRVFPHDRDELAAVLDGAHVVPVVLHQLDEDVAKVVVSVSDDDAHADLFLSVEKGGVHVALRHCHPMGLAREAGIFAGPTVANGPGWMGSDEVRMETVLVVRRYAILEAFVARARELELFDPTVSATEIARPAGMYLHWMSRALGGMRTEPMEGTRVAYDYADERMRIGFEAHAILTELGVLRAIVADVAIKSGISDPREMERLSGLAHHVVVEAVVRVTTTGPKRVTSTVRMGAATRRSR